MVLVCILGYLRISGHLEILLRATVRLCDSVLLLCWIQLEPSLSFRSLLCDDLCVSRSPFHFELPANNSNKLFYFYF